MYTTVQYMPQQRRIQLKHHGKREERIEIVIYQRLLRIQLMYTFHMFHQLYVYVMCQVMKIYIMYVMNDVYNMLFE